MAESFEWQPQFLHLKAIESSIANHVLKNLLTRVVINPSYLVFFRDSVTEMCLDGRSLKSQGPDSAEWPKAITKMRLLRSLSISQCPRIRDDHIVPLGNAPPHLTSLSLDCCARLTPAALSHLAPALPLRSITFIGSRGGPSQKPMPQFDPISHLSVFTHLTQLRLSDKAVGDPAMATISELTSLLVLSVAGCTVTQAGADRLTSLASLQTLDMSWTLAQHPPALHRLQSLHMDHCTIGGGWELAYAMHESQAGAAGDSGGLFAELTHLSFEGASLETLTYCEVGARLVAFLVAAAGPALLALHAGSVRGSEATHATLLAALSAPAPSLTTLSLWDVQLPLGPGQRFAAVPSPGPHRSLLGLAPLPRLRHLRVSCGGSGVERTASVLLGLEAVAELAALTGLESLDFDSGMDVPLLGVCRLLRALTSLTRLSTRGPRRPDLQTDFAVQDGDIPSAPNLLMLRAALQRPLPRGLLRRLLVDGAPALRHVDLVCSGAGAGGFDGRELALLCRLPHLSHLRFRCGARPDAAAALTGCPSLCEVEISSWSCPPWPHAVLREVAAVLARRGGFLTVAGEHVTAGAGPGEWEGAGGTPMPAAALRLRYPRSVMMALRGTAASQQSLRASGLHASVPPALAAVPW
eukprot:jgi/Ulvmu1/8576/UM045_0018.1